MNKIPKLYVLKDPASNEIRYVGITIRSLKTRLQGHLNDVRNRPNLNYHKINWIRSILNNNQIPLIELVAEFKTLEEAKQAEINYITNYKQSYDLTNGTIGGDHLGLRTYTRESILARPKIRAVCQYNILGELIKTFECTEDAARSLNKSGSKITLCCKKKRAEAYGYIWRYKEDPLEDISEYDKESLHFNHLLQCDLNGDIIKVFKSYSEASKAIKDGSKGGNIAAAARKNGGQNTCKGFIWKLEYNFKRLSLNSSNSVNNKQNTELSPNRESVSTS